MSNSKLQTIKNVAEEVELGGMVTTFCHDKDVEKHFPNVFKKIQLLKQLEDEVITWSEQYWEHSYKVDENGFKVDYDYKDLTD